MIYYFLNRGSIQNKKQTKKSKPKTVYHKNDRRPSKRRVKVWPPPSQPYFMLHIIMCLEHSDSHINSCKGRISSKCSVSAPITCSDAMGKGISRVQGSQRKWGHSAQDKSRGWESSRKRDIWWPAGFGGRTEGVPDKG